MKSGIAVAGSILVDSINEISAYPQAGELTKIKRVQKSVGGCVPNVAIDLKRICPQLSVKAVGKIGADENGEYVKEVLLESGVDIENISVGKDKTSFTEVMSVTGGQRTFFTYPGASADFGVNDVPMSALNVKKDADNKILIADFMKLTVLTWGNQLVLFEHLDKVVIVFLSDFFGNFRDAEIG